MMYALVAPMLVFGGGAAIDYGRAAQIHTKLNAAADAAALAALTPAMLQQSTTVAHDAAVNMFNGLTENLPGLTANATQVTVSVTVGATALTRNVEVSYSSSVNTIFAQVLHVNALQVSGVSEASAAGAAQYRLLRPARQFAIDGAAGDGGRHHPDGGPDDKETKIERRRLRLRLPPGQHQQHRHRRKPLHRRNGADLVTPFRRRQRRVLTIVQRSTARRSTITRLPARTTSRSVWTS